MNRSKQTLAKTTAAAVMLAFIGNASAQFSPQTELHLDAATRNTLGDADLMNNIRYYFCGYTDNPGFVNIVRSWNTIKIPLTQIAGDTWYLGSKYVGQYILRSPTGFVLVDSLNNTAEARDLTIPALQSLGLSASLPLQGVYLTHGHGDHDGGANYLRQTLNPPIYLGSGDANNMNFESGVVAASVPVPFAMVTGPRAVTTPWSSTA